MKRVLATGTAVAVGDGTLLGAALALGWTTVAVAAAVVGVVGAVLVAMSTPARSVTPATPATVTLGLPLRDEQARSETAGNEPARQPVRDEASVGTVGAPSPVAA